MSLCRLWAWLWRTPPPRPAPRVPEAALREIAATERRLHEARERLTLLGILGTMPEPHGLDTVRNDRVYHDARDRVDILMEGERRARRYDG